MASNSYNTQASRIALGGLMTSLAVVLMCVGTVIPVATYAAPVLCMFIGQIVVNLCGSRTAWAWFGAVAVLGLLLAPDKEAAAVFCVLGYYPIVKPKLDRTRGRGLWKALLFNGSILLLYWILLKLIGMEWLLKEFDGVGPVMTVVLLLMGNVTFFLLDLVLDRRFSGKKRGGC